MFAQGQFELLTVDEYLAAVEEDGKPRFSVCDGVNFAKSVGDEELFHAASSLNLFLRLDPSCFLSYMNACGADDATENITRDDLFTRKNPTKETAPGLLVDAVNGVSFSVSRGLKKGEQLLHHFPSRASILKVKAAAAAAAAAAPSGSSVVTRASATIAGGAGASGTN